MINAVTGIVAAMRRTSLSESKKRMNESSFSDFMKRKQDPKYLADTEALMNSIQLYVDNYDSGIYAEQNLRKAMEDLKTTLRNFSK